MGDDAPATWPTSKRELDLYGFWQYEVANGNTLRGFRDWVATEYDPTPTN